MQKKLWDNSDNDILIYLKHSKGTSVVADKHIKMLKSKIYKRMRADEWTGITNQQAEMINST